MEYYSYWERLIFQALNTMVLRAMEKLQNMMNKRTLSKSEDKQEKKDMPPLFKV